MVSYSRRDKPSRCSTSLSRPCRLRGWSCLRTGTVPGKSGEKCCASSSNRQGVEKRASLYSTATVAHVFQQVYVVVLHLLPCQCVVVVFLPGGMLSANANGLMWNAVFPASFCTRGGHRPTASVVPRSVVSAF